MLTHLPKLSRREFPPSACMERGGGGRAKVLLSLKITPMAHNILCLKSLVMLNVVYFNLVSLFLSNMLT